MPYMHDSGLDSTTTWFIDRLLEQDAAHDGGVLRGWAKLVLAELPDGPIELLSTSTEGCALAAVVAATREAGPTRWRRLDLGLNDESTDGYRAVVVEAVELGAGLRAAISAALPDALVMSGIGLRRGLIAA